MPKATIISSRPKGDWKTSPPNEWVKYSGKLIIQDRKTNPIALRLKSEIYDTFIGEFMEKKRI